jgi:hypothetical protein
MGSRRMMQCGLCRRSFPASDFSPESGVRLLGQQVCRYCVARATAYCHVCRAGIFEKDFEEGRAVTLLGRRYCERCLKEAVRQSQPSDTRTSGHGRPVRVDLAPSAPPVSESRRSSDTDLRGFERFVPPREARLHIGAAGLGRLLGRNRVETWLDLSETGLRAIVNGTVAEGEEFHAELQYLPDRIRLAIVLEARHVHPSKSFPDCTVAGFRFEAPDRELRELIRTRLKKYPLLSDKEPNPSSGLSESD